MTDEIGSKAFHLVLHELVSSVIASTDRFELVFPGEIFI